MKNQYQNGIRISNFLNISKKKKKLPSTKICLARTLHNLFLTRNSEVPFNRVSILYIC